MSYYEDALLHLQSMRGASEHQIYDAINDFGLATALIELEQATNRDPDSRDLRSHLQSKLQLDNSALDGIIDSSLALSILASFANGHDNRDDIVFLAEYIMQLRIRGASAGGYGRSGP